MPSAHPIPSLASLALSLYASAKIVERLPVQRTWNPWETVKITISDLGVIAGYMRAGDSYEGI
jgi:hypothetical protein